MVQRLDWIDRLKGFAILSVVIGHCVTDCISSNNYPEYSALLRMLYDIIYSFHMPLFFIISGFVFYLSKSYKKYKIKAMDFTLIYIIWCLFLWLSKFIMASDVNNPVTIIDLLTITYKPLMVYWYLYVLIFMYVAASIIKIYVVDTRVLIGLAIIAVASRMSNLEIGIANAFVYHMYFFLMGGYILQSDLLNKLNRKHCFILIGIILINIFMYFYDIPINRELMIVKNFLLANVISLLCFYLLYKNNISEVLETLGVNTLQIYVMHCFFTGGLRVLFAKLGIHNIYMYFLLGTIMGTTIPIFTANLFKNFPILNIIFEPINSLKKLGVIKN